MPLKEPGVHAVQDVAPNPLKVPALQVWQELEPEKGLNVPALQRLQNPEPAALYVPAPQLLQNDEPLELNVPAAHVLHVAEPNELYVPAEHERQAEIDVLAESGLKVPSGQE